MNPNKAKSILKQLYYRVDKEIDNMQKVCSKGCFFCCYQPIEILTIEKETLGEFIRTQISPETQESIKAKTIEWLDYFDNNTPAKAILTSEEAFRDFRFKAENIPYPCPLLFNGECSVYKARPLACRTHFVNDDKRLCEKDKLRDASVQSMTYRDRVVQSLKQTMEIEITPLSYALAEILRLNRKMKKIKKSVLK